MFNMLTHHVLEIGVVPILLVAFLIDIHYQIQQPTRCTSFDGLKIIYLVVIAHVVLYWFVLQQKAIPLPSFISGRGIASTS
jgi:hypothetical protein